MSIILLGLLGIFFVLLGLVIYFFRARSRIVRNPNVEQIHIAHPAIAEEVQTMVERIASIAEVPTPEVFIFRAELPNAFIISSRKKPLLFLADELFEECDELGSEKGLAKLEWAICHEIAHIKERHALKSGITETLDLAGQRLKVNRFTALAVNRRTTIEHQANARAKILFKKIECFSRPQNTDCL